MLAEALEEVRVALGAEDWARALPAALTAWRSTRSTELADLVDRITARCALPKPPHTRSAIHRWWITNAIDPDPQMIGTLLATFTDRMYVDDVPWGTIRARWTTPNPIIDKVDEIPPPGYLVQWAANKSEPFVWNRRIPNWVERVAAIFTWPDDPRVARVLATLLGDPGTHLEGDPAEGPWVVIADKLRALGDRRITSVLAKREERFQITSRQRALMALKAELAAPEQAVQSFAALAETLAPMQLPDPAIEVGPLWDEVSAHPADDAPRLVLADALLAAGDNRGELIVLQCAPDPGRRGRAATEAHRLIRREWERWMGDLALVLARRGTEMKRGMLHAIRVGMSATPSWAWEAIRGHRELGCVAEVRPAMVAPVTFAKLIAGLPRFPRLLEIDAHEVLTTLLETHQRQPLEEVFYASVNNQVNYRRPRPAHDQLFGMLARLAPDLQRLDLGALWWLGGEVLNREISTAELVERVTVIRHLFPRLARLRIVTSTVREDARAAVGRLGVEWIDSRPGF